MEKIKKSLLTFFFRVNNGCRVLVKMGQAMPTKVDRTGMLVGMRGRMRLALFILSEPLRAIGLGYAKRCILSAIIGLAMLWCGVCRGVGFMVEGRLEYYRPQNAPMRDYFFEAAISEEKWILKIYEGGKRRQRGHWEHGFEGTNEFTLYYVNQEPYEVAVKNTNFVFINGVVKPRTSPAISQFTPVHVFWFAFRCAVYTNEQYSRVPWHLTTTPGLDIWSNDTVDVVYTYSDGGEIDEISLLNPGVFYTFQEKYPLPPPYDKGYVSAHLKVLGREKVGSLTIPTEFEWCVYSPKVEWTLPPKKSFGASSNDLDVWERFYARVTKVLALESVFSAIPEAPSRDAGIAVSDYRFQEQVGDKSARYLSRGRFLCPGEAEWKRQIKQVRAVIQASAGSETHRSSTAKVILLGFFIISFCFLVILAKRHWGRT